MKNNQTKNIDRYLLGEMSETEKSKFEKELNQNPDLKAEVELQQSIYAAAQRQGMRQSVKKVAKGYHLMQWIKWAGLSLALIAAVATTLVISLNEDRAKKDETIKSEESFIDASPGLIENLSKQAFLWQGADTLFISDEGVLLSVPENSLLQNGQPYKGEAIIEWQEAMDGANIMKAGLSTMADSNLLETQGMFSLRITDTEGNLLEVNPEVGIYVQAPVDERKPGMQLYDGEWDKDSIINWVNPVPLEKIPVPVPMSELDFYPKGYEDTLDRLKLKQDRKYRDSLYLACEPDIDYSGGSNAQKEEFSGKDLFHGLCATCHTPYKDATGPKLKNVRQKWKDGGASQGSIYQWVQNWEKAVKNDEYAENVSRWSPVAMIKFDYLTKQDIDKIFDYVDYEYDENDKIDSEKAEIKFDTIDYFFDNNIEYLDVAATDELEETISFIPPSKVLSFWNPKFDNTLLATREFERRMQTLHGICEEKLLDIYINNLDQPLWFSDSLIMAKGHKEFENYFAERVGKMEVENAHVEGLKKFYEAEIKKLRQRMQEERQAEKQKERDWDKQVADERQKEASRKIARESQAFAEEVDVNHQRTSRQLGFTQGFTLRSNVRIVNIDREVSQATRNRKTTTIAFEGKSSTIQYNDFSFTVENHTNYERIYTYLLPDKLNSYQRISGKKGVFDYPLNNEINYDVVVLGVNESGYFYSEILQINEGNFGIVTLEPIAENDFDQRIQELNNNRIDVSVQMTNELKWLRLEKENYKVQRLRQEKRQFLDRMRRVVFPCYKTSDSTVDQVETVNYPDIEAQFPGGSVAMRRFIAENLNYPQEAMENYIQGKVYLDVDLDRFGKVINVEVIRSPSEVLSKEAMRLVYTFPNYIPAVSQGVNVSSTTRVPVHFGLQ